MPPHLVVCSVSGLQAPRKSWQVSMHMCKLSPVKLTLLQCCCLPMHQPKTSRSADWTQICLHPKAPADAGQLPYSRPQELPSQPGQQMMWMQASIASSQTPSQQEPRSASLLPPTLHPESALQRHAPLLAVLPTLLPLFRRHCGNQIT